MSLSHRLNAIEAEARALRARVAALEQWQASVEQALAAEEADDQEEGLTLDGGGFAAGDRDQTRSLG